MFLLTLIPSTDFLEIRLVWPLVCWFFFFLLVVIIKDHDCFLDVENDYAIQDLNV